MWHILKGSLKLDFKCHICFNTYITFLLSHLRMSSTTDRRTGVNKKLLGELKYISKNISKYNSSYSLSVRFVHVFKTPLTSARGYGNKTYIVVNASIEKVMNYCNSARVYGNKKYTIVNASIKKLMIYCNTGYHAPSVPSTLIGLISYVLL